MIAQLITILKKDFKMLLRSKSSTTAVLLGPLLIVLLVGLVFTNAGTPELVVGVVKADFENSQQYLASLTDAFSVIEYTQEADCVQAVRQGKTVSCIKFSAGNPPKAIIYVDPSDINVVYAVIDRVTGQLENQSSVLRGGFATQLLDSVTKSTIKLRDDTEQLAAANLLLTQQEEKTQALATNIRGLQVDVQVVSPRDVADAIDASVNARDEYRAILQEMLEGYESLANKENNTKTLEKIDAAWEKVNNLDEEVSRGGDEIFVELLSLVEDIESEVGQTEQNAQALSSQAAQIKNSIALAQQDTGAVLASMRQTRESLSALDISKSQLTNPVEPHIEPVTTQDDKFGFAFPYFITLIIMFTSVLLASTLIVRERTSEAFFRNFTTPTPEWIFVISTYLTTTITLLLQLIIIYTVASFFITFGIAGSLLTWIPLLLIVVTFFSLLGMLIGYIFKNQEAVMLAAITVSSILLFVSNLVLPSDTIPKTIQAIINANPMVLSSELLKATLVFGFGLGDVALGFGVLILYSAIMFVAIMIVQRLTRIRYFELAGAPERISEFLVAQEIPEGKELSIGEWTVASKEELLRALKLMDDEEYEKYASHKHNAIADWILDVYKDDRLARVLRNKSRQGTIEVLEKEQKK